MKISDTMPWSIRDNYYIYDKHELYMGGTAKTEAAQYIVTACNLYPELIEALEGLVKAHDASEGYEFYRIEELLGKIK